MKFNYLPDLSLGQGNRNQGQGVIPCLLTRMGKKVVILCSKEVI